MTARANTDDWIVRFHEIPQPHLRLFCFPNAGGAVAQFRTWHQSLPAGVEVCPVQLPGQGSRFREEPFTRLQPLAETLAEVLSPCLDVPYAFWGYSMGALISFVLAHELKRRGAHGPASLFIAARSAPHVPPVVSPIHTLPEPQFITEVQRRYNGIPEAILQERELLSLLLPVLRANFEMIETYTFPGDRLLDIPMMAFGGLQDPTVNTRQIAAWGELTSQTFRYFMFPGDHFFLQNHLPAILQIVTRELAPRTG
jgi:medium-chain acyl-[acyl-carrier-protein] hydrolase